MHKPNQFDLFASRRFLPLFVTQFFGAFNDNLFKNAFLVLITFYGLSTAGLDAKTLVNAAAGIFILPFFLFSALAGQLAEKYDKARLAQWIKLLEIGIMLLAGLGFYQKNATVLFVCLFLMGVHSTLFGPLKYSVLPQYLKEEELLGGNGLIEAGTFIAILVGQIAGTLIVQHQPHGETLIIYACVGVAVLGFLSSRAMPRAAPPAPDLKINWNILGETWHIIRHVSHNRTVFHSLMGISWFWFFGSVYLTQLPDLSRNVLNGDPGVYTLLITLFSAGVGLGSTLCERLSGRRVELGLVPFGSIGMSVFGTDLYFALNAAPAAAHYDAWGFIADPAHWRVMFDIAAMGAFGGLFIVPLYALVQTRTEKAFVSRAIAANNILNSLFMVVAALMSIALLKAGLTVPGLLLTVALMNIAVALYIYTLIPEFLMRFLVWIGVHTLYRVRCEGLEHIPEEGPCVLVCNHVSFMDALILAGMIRRPIRFVMDHRIFKVPVLNFIFRTAGAIPIAPAREDAALKDRAFDRVAEYLEAGEVVCIFPEGAITRDGEIKTFRPGIEDIVRRTPVPVIPLALRGLWGSFFSRKDGAAMMKLPRRIWSKIGLVAGAPVPAAQADRDLLEQQVRALRGDWR
ncbi:MFS transporter [Chitiniphilus shinanonensis]|uniref:MFS transporter n=1 Tax=Chitiniphilus shinanonensis TaxID=553088 RepID=A0ABQ6BTY1_9NEIS|nr:MFS transporter [Chitiniphilus shinanonensis]GLS03348.1 MFS transporter [Chitiniphilus shinanonensis]